MTLHETCVQQNDIAVDNPIYGKAKLRKVNPGTWTRTIVSTGCKMSAKSGTGKSYGPGGSGKGVLIKKLKAADGGQSMRPEQDILVFMGPKVKGRENV